MKPRAEAQRFQSLLDVLQGEDMESCVVTVMVGVLNLLDDDKEALQRVLSYLCLRFGLTSDIAIPDDDTGPVMTVR